MKVNNFWGIHEINKRVCVARSNFIDTVITKCHEIYVITATVYMLHTRWGKQGHVYTYMGSRRCYLPLSGILGFASHLEKCPVTSRKIFIIILIVVKLNMPEYFIPLRTIPQDTLGTFYHGGHYYHMLLQISRYSPQHNNLSYMLQIYLSQHFNI